MSTYCSIPPRWKPLPDPQRPDFPYQAGLDLSIRRHVPPVPFGRPYEKGSERQIAPRKDIESVPQSEWCLSNPPTSTADHPDPTPHSLCIVDGVACEDGRGAQVVKCRLDGDETRVYVGKIFDPFYYSHIDRDMEIAVDVAWEADKDYSREAAAFEGLSRSKVDGIYAPEYYGSWTFQMLAPGAPQTTRPVRMILMEWIQGVSMWSLIKSREVYRFPPQQRLDILAEAMEALSRMDFYGVIHGDFAPRNLILVGLGTSNVVSKVVLVDFGKSIVHRLPNFPYKLPRTHLPMNPEYRHWGPCSAEFSSWIPEPHRSRPAAFKGWLKAQWGTSPDFASRDEDMSRHSDDDESVEMVSPAEDKEPEDDA
ncbi:hypothetical protein FZEAL_5068 [Fusarium zealandicum]|uniref:EKC/KEOPS complex subunit BUD32 n=1 Tax=Fusarium zealandicum TaxID=1053134 RepID=A0A8H4UL82_9HYPO|nr:hypothetical protein FZEAL_5068 [Fusarium zealandicum]